MSLRKLLPIAASILLTFFSLANAQQPVDESKIGQLRSTIERLAHLSVDANIPAETRQNLSELLFEKRGELHGLLRQKRDSLRSSLSSVTSATASAEINEKLQRIIREMQELSGASTPSSSSAGTSTAVSVGPSAAIVPSTETTVTSGGATGATNQPVLATPASTPASAAAVAAQPASTQPAAAPVQGPCADLLNAAPGSTRDYKAEIRAAACRMELARANNVVAEEQLNVDAYTSVIALGLLEPKIRAVAVPELTAQAENASNSKNLSSVASSSGSTSLVSKAGLPAVFGFAVENGALTRTNSGTTVTFTGNPVGIVQALAKKGYITSFQNQSDFTGFLRKLSFGVSFDTSRGDQAGVFTADRQQLSGFSFKFNIMDQRDPRHKRHTDRWSAITREQATNLARSFNNFVRAFRTGPRIPVFEAWLTETNTKLAGKTSFAEIETILETELQKLPSLELPADVQAMVEEVGTNFDAFLAKRNDILDEISNGWIATFDYNNERPAGMPSLSNFRFLVEKGAYKGSIDFTGNASLTVYNSRPTDPGIQRLRDFRFAGQIDVPMGDVSKTGKFMLSFAGRYERLLNDEPIEGTTEIIRKGDIAVGQVKLTIPIRGTAMKIPLSISFANRTDLIQEREIRGNFGVTFDLDSILAKFNPFSRP
jgi:hypothetical protein